MTPATAGGTSEEPEDQVNEHRNGRPLRNAVTNRGSRGWSKRNDGDIEGYNSADNVDDEEDYDASEQDYGDDEDEDEHVPVDSEEDDQDNFSEEADDLDDLNDLTDGEKKSLVVKLPVKTPTPERCSTVKHPTASVDVSSNPIQGPSDIFDDTSIIQTSSNNTSDSTNLPRQSVLNGAGLDRMTDYASTDASVGVQAESDSPIRPVSIMQKSNNAAAATPMSPSLAFRGSQRKQQHFRGPLMLDIGVLKGRFDLVFVLPLVIRV